MSESNKYTVIIPTRERAETLYHTLRTVVEQEYDNLNIIVSDNFSQDNTKDVVTSFSDSRIRYINTGRRMSMSENFEFGLNHVSEGFVMFIGDDDGLLPGAIRRVNAIVEKTGMRAVTSGIAQYVWPNHPDERSRHKMSWSIRDDVEIRRSSEWIRNVLSFRPLYTFDLPGLYCGFVHIDVINSMKKDGVFFRSQTPDAYSAFACAVALNTYAFSHRPFAIHGASGRSNGASYLGGGDKSESEKFFKENTIPFHPMLRVCPSFRVIASETFLQLRDAFPEKTSQYKFDLPALLSVTLSERNDHSRIAIEQAVSEMATVNNIDMNRVLRLAQKKWPRVQRYLFELSKLLPLRVRYSRVPDSSKIGVWNIYDAAKAMAVFFGLNDGIVTSRYHFYVKRFLGLFK
ncbi:MAG: glycosyltransferase family 2 protein [Bacteroidota bacterium]